MKIAIRKKELFDVVMEIERIGCTKIASSINCYTITNIGFLIPGKGDIIRFTIKCYF